MITLLNPPGIFLSIKVSLNVLLELIELFWLDRGLDFG